MKHKNYVPTSKRMMSNLRIFGILFLLVSLPILACSMPTIPFIQAPAALTPEPPPTQTDDTLTLLAPAYAISLEPGETVPGTGLSYIGRSGDAYEVSIDGLNAAKRPGDSFYWSGVIAPGVFANYNLRLTTSLFGGLPIGGPVELVVLFPEAVEVSSTEGLDIRYHFGNLLLDYKVPVRNAVPGTTLTYEGVEAQGGSDQGSKLARFSGFNGYPFLAVGDSLVWSGRLRDNVMVRYSLRTVSFDEERIHLVGTGDLWILN